MRKHKDKPWTRSDTAKALGQFEHLFTEVVHERVPDLKLADEICYFARLYKEGIISTKSFLRVVKDIAGGV